MAASAATRGASANACETSRHSSAGGPTRRRQPDQLAVESEHVRRAGAAQLQRGGRDCVEDRLHIRRRLADHAQDLARRGLLLQGFQQALPVRRAGDLPRFAGHKCPRFSLGLCRFCARSIGPPCQSHGYRRGAIDDDLREDSLAALLVVSSSHRNSDCGMVSPTVFARNATAYEPKLRAQRRASTAFPNILVPESMSGIGR